MENSFKNANTLIHTIKEIASIKLISRPFNRFKPDNTMWWLTPTTEWPAYKYGKLFFQSRPERMPAGKEGIYTGFNIEKGLSLRVANFYHNSLIMKGDWLWDEFIGSLPEATISLSGDYILTIVASYIPPEKANFSESPESFLAQKESFDGSRVSFEMKPNLTIEAIDKKLNTSNKDISRYFEQKIVTAGNLKSLFSQLLDIPQADWVWVDLYFGIIIPENKQGITPTSLWKQYLEPWVVWLRKSKNN
ncbi:hypothetical protein KJ969_00360 [Patescibacteria group bacterium]|nr:hypothetical protein [Patescibacteria group bacterium]MBU1922536.1 hypothetical protein [Patescibacteria group bacterium]